MHVSMLIAVAPSLDSYDTDECCNNVWDKHPTLLRVSNARDPEEVYSTRMTRRQDKWATEKVSKTTLLLQESDGLNYLEAVESLFKQ